MGYRNMGPYFASDYHGTPFAWLGAAHLGALLVIFALVLLGWRLELSPRGRRAVRFGLAGLMLANEIFWHAFHAYHGLWSLQYLLPLNLCNVMVLTSVFTLLTRHQVGYEFIYLLGIPAASQVLITPALGSYGFPHILFFQIFISHGGIVLAALYLTLGEGFRPRSWRAVAVVTLSATLYTILIFCINPLLGGNYMFLAYKPPAATLLDYLGPWPWYILTGEAIGLALIALLYLPFHLKDKNC